ncbi:MAG: hypothetical protein IPI66_01085 [Chitinophagaceae bacterium]|nr:hypothetical protein [Chitinophagaceae bacterium]
MPRSTLFPSLGMELLNGIKLFLKEQGLSGSVQWITDNIGFGTNEADIYAKAEKMLLQEEADLVILCADTTITEMLQPLFTASDKILLAVNFGANFPENWTPAPTTVTHSLNFAFSPANRSAGCEGNQWPVGERGVFLRCRVPSLLQHAQWPPGKRRPAPFQSRDQASAGRIHVLARHRFFTGEHQRQNLALPV